MAIAVNATPAWRFIIDFAVSGQRRNKASSCRSLTNRVCSNFCVNAGSLPAFTQKSHQFQLISANGYESEND